MTRQLLVLLQLHIPQVPWAEAGGLASTLAGTTTIAHYKKSFAPACRSPCHPDDWEHDTILYVTNFSDPHGCHGVFDASATASIVEAGHPGGAVGGRYECADDGGLDWVTFENQDCTGEVVSTMSWSPVTAATFFSGACVCDSSSCYNISSSSQMITPTCVNSSVLTSGDNTMGCAATRLEVTMKDSSSGLPGWSSERTIDDEFCRGLASAYELNATECEAAGIPCDCMHMVKDAWSEIETLAVVEMIIVCISQCITLMNTTLLLWKLSQQKKVHPEPSEEDPVARRKTIYYKVQFRSLLFQNIVFIGNIVIQFALMFVTLDGAQPAAYAIMKGNCTNDVGHETWNQGIQFLYDVRIYGVAGIMLTLFAMILNVKLTLDVHSGQLKKPLLSIVQICMVAFVLGIGVLKYTICTLTVNNDLKDFFAAMPGTTVASGIKWSVEKFQVLEKSDVIHSVCDSLAPEA